VNLLVLNSILCRWLVELKLAKEQSAVIDRK
jgi:hypothetical protein